MVMATKQRTSHSAPEADLVDPGEVGGITICAGNVFERRAAVAVVARLSARGGCCPRGAAAHRRGLPAVPLASGTLRKPVVGTPTSICAIGIPGWVFAAVDRRHAGPSRRGSVPRDLYLPAGACPVR